MRFNKRLFLSIICLFILLFASSCEIEGDDVIIEEENETKQYEIYRLAYSSGYDGTYEEWLETIKGIDGTSITSVIINDKGELVVTLSNGTICNCGVIKGEKGNQGETGNGISSIEKTSSEGLADTYTITYTNGTTSTFQVTNGSQGEQGIQGIEGKKGEDGHSPVITIGENGNWFIDGVDTTKPSNIKGDTGNGISSIDKTSSEGLIDTYTITYTNGTTSTFQVTNGSQGEQGIQGVEGKQGYTPLLRINDENYWEASYDNGLTWQSLNVKARVDEIYHNVLLNYDNGEASQTESIKHGNNIATINDPVKEGYSFDGWYYGEIKWNKVIYPVLQDLELKAKWNICKYKLTLLNYYFDRDLFLEYDYNSAITIDNPVYPGWTFINYDISIPTKMLASDITIQCNWEENDKSMVVLDLNGGTGYDGDINFEINVGANYTLPLLTDKNYAHFLGWFDENDDMIPREGVWNYTIEKKLTARWTIGTYENGTYYITWGKFPKSYISDEETVNALNNLTTENIDEEGYYLYNEKQYYKSVGHPNAFLNTSFKNGDPVIDGVTYWFEVESLRWRVIGASKGAVKLMCDEVIYTLPYSKTNDPSYKNSWIREWMNSDFIKMAFNNSTSGILLTNVDNSSSPVNANGKMSVGEENTNDYFFLLNYTEASKMSISERIRKCTDYSLCQYSLIYDTTTFEARWFGRGYQLIYDDKPGYVLFIDCNGYFQGTQVPIDVIGLSGICPVMNASFPLN